MLKLSEIFLIEWFLNTEKSRFDVPGPVKRLRPAVPRRLKHCGNGAATGGSDVSLGWSVAGYLVQLLSQKVMSGPEWSVDPGTPRCRRYSYPADRHPFPRLR